MDQVERNIKENVNVNTIGKHKSPYDRNMGLRGLVPRLEILSPSPNAQINNHKPVRWVITHTHTHVSHSGLKRKESINETVLEDRRKTSKTRTDQLSQVEHLVHDAGRSDTAVSPSLGLTWYNGDTRVQH